ncbi:MAG TPA: hypothetical protein VL993_11235, partial [Stellaceae bacterium]|nr:hypothetical protein [Stellaceae bacterium]
MNALQSFFSGHDQSGFAIVAGVAVLVTLVLLGQAFLPEDSMSSRVRSHIRRRNNMRTERVHVRQRIANLRTAPIGTLRTVLARLKLLSGEEARKGGELLANAGWRARDALTVLMAVRLALPAALGLIAFAACLTQQNMPSMMRITTTV